MKISGTGSAHPSKIVTNDMLTQMFDTSDEWITTRTGIKERRVISSEYLIDIAVEAVRKALDDAKMNAEDLDFIICSNVVNEYVTPAMSCMIQSAIGAKCPCMDINGACVGFIYCLDIAEAYYKIGKVKNVLVVSAEEPSGMLNWHDRTCSVLFGDGAGAAVLTPGDNIKATRLSASPACDRLCERRELQYTPFNTKTDVNMPLVMHGQDVFKFATNAAIKDLSSLLSSLNISANDIDTFLIHQANLRIIKSIQDYLEQPKEKFPVIIHKYGNTSSASLPMLLDELNREGKLKSGDMLALSAFGAGFVSGACILEW